MSVARVYLSKDGYPPKPFLGVFNVRPLVLAFIYLALGIMVSALTTTPSIYYCTLTLSLRYLKKLLKLDDRTFVLVLCCICLSLFVLVYKAYLDFALVSSGQACVEGRVIDSYRTDEGYTTMIDKLTIGGVDRIGKMRFTSTVQYESGAKLYIEGDVKTYFLSTDIYALRRVCKRQFYDIAPYTVEVFAYSKLPLNVWLQKSIYQTLCAQADQDTASFALSLMFGQSQYFEQLSSYREVNLAHLFAVSGLHVGTLAGVVYFICRKVFKRSRTSLATIVPIGVIICIYAYLCKFSPSVVRAFGLITLSLILAKSRIYADGLSTLSAVAIVSLIIKPLWLFDISFILSYAAVAGIILLTPVTEKLLRKTRLPSKFIGFLSVNTAVCLAVMPISAYCFGSASLVSIPLSIIYIPLASVAYVYFLICMPFLWIDALSPLLVPAELFVKLSNAFVGWLDGFDVYVSANIPVVGLAVWFAALLLCSHHCMLSPKRKLVVSLLGFSASLISIMWL